jgi:hypothetical protein
MIPTISISIWLSALVCVSRTHLRKLTKRNNLDVSTADWLSRSTRGRIFTDQIGGSITLSYQIVGLFFFMENINIYRKRYYNKPFNQCILHLQVIKKTIDDRENVQTNVHVYVRVCALYYVYILLFVFFVDQIYIYIYTYWNDDRSWSFHFINHMGFQTVEIWEKKKTTFFSLHF